MTFSQLAYALFFGVIVLIIFTKTKLMDRKIIKFFGIKKIDETAEIIVSQRLVRNCKSQSLMLAYKKTG